jgi:hypothetical protein
MIIFQQVSKKIIKVVTVEFSDESAVDHLLVVDNELSWYFIRIENEENIVLLQEGSLSLFNYTSDKVDARDLEKKIEESTVSLNIENNCHLLFRELFSLSVEPEGKKILLK